MDRKIIVNYNLRLFAFILPFALSLFISSRVFASDPTALEAAQVIHDDCYNRYGLDYSIAQTGYTQAGSFWSAHPSYTLFTWQLSNNPAFVRYVISNDFYNLPTEGQIRFNSYSLLELGPNGQCNWYETNTNTTYTCVMVGTLTDLLVPDIDFDNTNYDPTISVPSFRCLIGSYSSSFCVPVNLLFDTPDGISSYYIEFKYRYYKPNTVRFDLQNGINYSTLDFDSSDWFYLFSMEDMIKFSDLNLNTETNIYGLNLNNSSYDCLDNWTDFYNSVNITFLSNYYSSESTAFQNARDRYLLNNKSSVFYGNSTEIFVRFFTIDTDNIVSVGDWRHWYSTSSNVFDIVSGSYNNGQEINSGSSIVSDYDQNMISQSQNNPPQTSDQVSTIVINNNQVPNNQEYPTAVSYNHDNILLQFIETSKQLPQTFEGYAAFLTSAFIFIPSQIWSIISFGFMASIVIMIVKVL